MFRECIVARNAVLRHLQPWERMLGACPTHMQGSPNRLALFHASRELPALPKDGATGSWIRSSRLCAILMRSDASPASVSSWTARAQDQTATWIRFSTVGDEIVPEKAGSPPRHVGGACLDDLRNGGHTLIGSIQNKGTGRYGRGEEGVAAEVRCI